MKGMKTYLVGALAVAGAALLWWYGAIDTGQAATLILVGLGLMTLRHGLTTERIKLLLELLAPYRPGRPRRENEEPARPAGGPESGEVR
ncbi:MAG: hypothetical protein ACE5H2_08205 [Terriglobia bacterium]